ncbi:hypothetical protein [Streptomyces sp. NPDC018352]|uniref:hypothetical protein n=1 Tax=Streptomyces sp. NPDC018352 TaxID=3157194 RepID=UPI0033C22CB4
MLSFEQIVGVISAVAGVGSLALQTVETLRKRREGNRDPEVSSGGVWTPSTLLVTSSRNLKTVPAAGSRGARRSSE